MNSLQNILFSFNTSPQKTTKKNNSNQKSVKKSLRGGSIKIDNQVVFTKEEKSALTNLLSTYKNGR
jgi:hypothetical protein